MVFTLFVYLFNMLTLFILVKDLESKGFTIHIYVLAPWVFYTSPHPELHPSIQSNPIRPLEAPPYKQGKHSYNCLIPRKKRFTIHIYVFIRISNLRKKCH